MLKRVFGNMAWAHLTVTQHVLIKTIFGEKKAVSRAVHVDDDPFTPSPWIQLKWKQGLAWAGKFRTNIPPCKLILCRKFQGKVTRDFYIFTEAAVFLTKEPNVSRDLYTGRGCSRRTFAVLKLCSFPSMMLSEEKCTLGRCYCHTIYLWFLFLCFSRK